MIKFLVYALLAIGFSLLGILFEGIGLFFGSHALSALFGYIYGAASIAVILKINGMIK